jgi:hypothetical protein
MAFYQDVIEPGVKPAKPQSKEEARILVASQTKPWSYDRALVVYDFTTGHLYDLAMSMPDDEKRNDILAKLEKYAASEEEIATALTTGTIAEKDAMNGLLRVTEGAHAELERLLASRKDVQGLGQFDPSALMSMIQPVLSKVLKKKARKAAAPPAPPAPPPAKGPSMTTIALIGAAVAVPILLILLMPSSAPAYPPPSRRR